MARLDFTLYSPLGRFLPIPGHLCLGQTTAGRTEVPCQEHRWVSWSVWSAPCSGDQDSDLRGNRRSSRPQWRRWGDSWNSRWMFSTVWCCSVSCLTEQKMLKRAAEGTRLTYIHHKNRKSCWWKHTRGFLVTRRSSPDTWSCRPGGDRSSPGSVCLKSRVRNISQPQILVSLQPAHLCPRSLQERDN